MAPSHDTAPFSVMKIERVTFVSFCRLKILTIKLSDDTKSVQVKPLHFLEMWTFVLFIIQKS